MMKGSYPVFILLLIEFLDEFVGGVREAAWPLIRTDLGLNYAQIGLLLSLPIVISNLIEPFLGILGDVWRRRVLILGGGVVFALALLLTALSGDFLTLLISFVIFCPASGAFVTLSQATLMDTDPARREQNMARWTFAGSLGVLTGPLLALGAAAILNLGWRGLFFLFAGLALMLLVGARRVPLANERSESDEKADFKAGIVGALRALRRGEVLCWLTLLQFSDLMLDVLLGFLALYFVDVAGTTPAQASVAVAMWTGAGLLGNLLLIPLLERVRGLRYLRLSTVVELVLFPIFLLVPGIWAKVALLGLLGLFSAGWYSILQAQLYTAMPGQSGTVMAVGNVFGLVGGLIPLGLGLIAERFDLVVTGISVVPSSPGAGQSATVYVTVRNQGNRAIAYGNNFYVDRASAPFLVGDIQWGAQGSWFGAGESRTFSGSYTFTGGSHQLYAQADTDNTVVEANEGNNVLGPAPLNVTGLGGGEAPVAPVAAPTPGASGPRPTPTPKP